MNLYETLEKTKLIAILRGISPKEILPVSEVLVEHGFRIIEVPLNSPDVFTSIEMLVKFYSNDQRIHIGAGTVCDAQSLQKLKDIGATIAISPNVNIEIIRQTIKHNMHSVPGFMTPSEAYSAIQAGAKILKLFPFKTLGAEYLHSIRTILPPNLPIVAVGGINEANIADYLKHGVQYFGLGNCLYAPNMDIKTIEKKAKFFTQTMGDFDATLDCY